MYLNISVEGDQQTCDLQKRYFPTAKSLIFMGILIIVYFLKNLGVKISILFIMYLLVTVSYTKT